MPKRCKAKKQDDSPCQAPGVSESGYCFWHDPARAGEVQEARKKGGKTRSQGRATVEEGQSLKLETASDTKAALALVINETRDGRLDFKVANSVFNGLSILLRAFDQVDTEAELAALRTEIEAMKGLRATG